MPDWLKLPDWLDPDPAAVGWIFAASLLLFVGTLITIPIIVARMRSRYFVDKRRPSDAITRQYVVFRLVFLVLKNVVGVLFVLAGLAMLVLPGQGIITILIGLSCMNFPGKRRLELRIVRQRHVYQAIDWIRRRAGRPSLVLPERDDD